MSIVAQTPSHRDESGDVFVHDASTLSAALFAILLRSVRSYYDEGVSAATRIFRHRKSWRFCYASATLLLCSCRSGYIPTALMLRYRQLSCAHADFVTLPPRFYRYLIIRSSCRPGSSAFLKWVSLFWKLGLTLLRISSNMRGSILM